MSLPVFGENQKPTARANPVSIGFSLTLKSFTRMISFHPTRNRITATSGRVSTRTGGLVCPMPRVM